MKLIFCVLVFLISSSIFAGDGLTLEVEDSKGNKDIRHTRLPALFVKGGTPVTPFVQAGPFKAVFKGSLSLKERSRVYFKIIGNGKATLKIGSETVLTADGDDLSKTVSERLRLNQGEHELTLEYESPAKGDAQVRLVWMGRSFPWEPIAPTYLKHSDSNALKKAALLRSGRETFARFNCIKCHSSSELKTANVMPEMMRDTPSLANAGNKFSESWLASWIQNPLSFRHDATMPKLLKHKSVQEALAAGDTSAIDLAAYLTSMKTDSYKSFESSAELIKNGGDHFHKLGCVACHTRPDKKSDEIRVPLSNIAWKFSSNTALATFLSNPAKHYKWIKMPDFGLNEKEAKEIAAFLMASSKEEAQFKKGNPEQGKKLYTTLGCVNCHDPKSTSTAKSLADISKGTLEGCIKGDKIQFNLTDEEKSSLKALLKGNTESLTKSAIAEFAERQLREVNCNACHQYDGKVSALGSFHNESSDLNVHEGSHLDQSRPILTWFGEKLQPEYLKKILSGEVDMRPRPWLDARMPAFKERAANLAEGLAASHGLSNKFEEGPKAEPGFEEIGKTLTGTQGGFSCIICHDAGPRKAMAAFEVKGIDLMLVKERIRPEYYMRWMIDPPRIVPHTKMPKFSNDGLTALTQNLEGDAIKQFWAIFEFLKQGRKLEAVK